MAKPFYRMTDGELLAWSANFESEIGTGFASFGFTSSRQATAFTTLNTSWTNAMAAWTTSATRTPIALGTKNTARTNLLNNAKYLVRTLLANPATTQAQCDALQINARVSPSPIPAPSVRPGMDIVSVSGRTILLNIHDSASSAKRGKPAGAKAAWVYSFVGADYPADPTEWNFEGSTTKAKFEVAFPSTMAGGTQVWVCAAWINGKQEAGPTSVPITTNLQGGGSSVESLKIAA